MLVHSCLTLCDPMNRSPPGSSVHGILQARILEWIAIPPPVDLPDPGIKPVSPVAAALQVDSLLLSHREALVTTLAFHKWLQLNLYIYLLFSSSWKHDKAHICFTYKLVSTVLNLMMIHLFCYNQVYWVPTRCQTLGYVLGTQNWVRYGYSF